MALDHKHTNQHQKLSSTPLQESTIWPWKPRRKVSLFRRRNKVQTVRLGGKKPRRRFLNKLVRVFRKMRVRWLKLQYIRMLKRLREHYKNILKDLIEAGSTIETFQQRLFMESTFAIPVGVNLCSYPSRFGSDYPRTLFM